MASASEEPYEAAEEADHEHDLEEQPKKKKGINEVWDWIMTVTFDGVTIHNTIGSLSRLAEAIWIVDAVKRHEGGQRCLELFKSYCIGKQILESDSTVFQIRDSLEPTQLLVYLRERLRCACIQ
jgi:hypothetical protein